MTPAFLWHPNGHTRIPFSEPRIIERTLMRRGKLELSRAISITAERFGLTVLEIRKKSNRVRFVVPRQVAMYVIRQAFPWASLPVIGEAFGGWHHTTVFHAVEKIGRLVQTDPELAATVQEIRAELEGA